MYFDARDIHEGWHISGRRRQVRGRGDTSEWWGSILTGEGVTSRKGLNKGLVEPEPLSTPKLLHALFKGREEKTHLLHACIFEWCHVNEKRERHWENFHQFSFQRSVTKEYEGCTSTSSICFPPGLVPHTANTHYIDNIWSLFALSRTKSSIMFTRNCIKRMCMSGLDELWHLYQLTTEPHRFSPCPLWLATPDNGQWSTDGHNQRRRATFLQPHVHKRNW